MPFWAATVCAVSIFYCGAIVYRPAVASPVKVASWLKTDKVQDRIEPRPVQTTKYRLDPTIAAVTSSPEHSLPWSCAAIRNAVANLTPDQIERLARVYRLSKWQRAEARRCLKERT